MAGAIARCGACNEKPRRVAGLGGLGFLVVLAA